MSGTNKTGIYQLSMSIGSPDSAGASVSILVIVTMNLARADKGEGASILLVLVWKSQGSLQ